MSVGSWTARSSPIAVDTTAKPSRSTSQPWRTTPGSGPRGRPRAGCYLTSRSGSAPRPPPSSSATPPPHHPRVLHLQAGDRRSRRARSGRAGRGRSGGRPEYFGNQWGISPSVSNEEPAPTQRFRRSEPVQFVALTGFEPATPWRNRGPPTNADRHGEARFALVRRGTGVPRQCREYSPNAKNRHLIVATKWPHGGLLMAAG
jgi:hypothetical protein